MKTLGKGALALFGLGFILGSATLAHAQVASPGNGKPLPPSAQKAPPFQGGGGGGGSTCANGPQIHLVQDDNACGPGEPGGGKTGSWAAANGLAPLSAGGGLRPAQDGGPTKTMISNHASEVADAGQRGPDHHTVKDGRVSGQGPCWQGGKVGGQEIVLNAFGSASPKGTGG